MFQRVAHLVLLLASWLAVCSLDVCDARANELSGVLGEGTAWETPWFSVEGDEPGPTVLVTGGIHGNEPAGSHAAEQIRQWPIRRGRLVVIPRVNRLGLEAGIRWLPQFRSDKARRDLNRNFPGRSGGFQPPREATTRNPDRFPTPRNANQPECQAPPAADQAESRRLEAAAAQHSQPLTPLAEALWEFVESIEPDYVLDLHEGFDFHTINPKSVGSSIICSQSAERTRLAQRMLDAVNSTLTDEDRRFELLSKSGAAQGSLVRACTDSLRIDAFILETTFKDQPISLRARQHRTMVSTLLREIGMVDRDCVDVLVADSRDHRLQVALYDAAGASANGLDNLTRALQSASGIAVVRVGPLDIRVGVLDQFDVVLFPGGSGSQQGRALGDEGRRAVREFVREGGGLVGVCAGAYLCSAHYDWSLHVINTAVFNQTVEIPGVGRKSLWYRGGPQDVEMEISASAEEILGRSGDASVKYQNGPIISPGKARDLPAYTPLAWFRSEVVRYEPQRGTMINTPAIVAAPYGRGRVLSVSPHPEATPGLEPLIVEGVRWAAHRKTVGLPVEARPSQARPKQQAM